MDSLLSRRELARFCEHDVRQVVNNDPKGRFEMADDQETGKLLIKATQGHSKMKKVPNVKT